MTPRNARELAARRYVDRWCRGTVQSDPADPQRPSWERWYVTFRDGGLEARKDNGIVLETVAVAPGWVSLARKLGWDGRVKR